MQYNLNENTIQDIDINVKNVSFDNKDCIFFNMAPIVCIIDLLRPVYLLTSTIMLPHLNKF